MAGHAGKVQGLNPRFADERTPVGVGVAAGVKGVVRRLVHEGFVCETLLHRTKTLMPAHVELWGNSFPTKITVL